MKKLLFLFLALPLLSAAPHKFYVSKTIIEFNPRSASYEVTCKIFTDDLEKALGEAAENKIRLGTDREVSNADELIEKYITQHLKIDYNNQPVTLSFIGKEAEADLTACYFEFVRLQEYNTISVENTILYEHFPDQKNIVDIRANASTKTIILTRERPKEIVSR